MKAVALLLALGALPGAVVDESECPAPDDHLAGVWFGTDFVRDYQLLFDRGELSITNRRGTAISTYTVAPHADWNHVDIVDSEGRLQKGIFRVAGHRLELRLADPGLERPTEFRSSSGGHGRVQYFFCRTPPRDDRRESE